MPTGWKILILDYDENVLLNIEHVLETAGFSTTVAWHADAFYRLLNENEFDLVVIGHRPPEVDAAEILRSLASNKVQKLVLTSATRHPFEEAHLTTLGAHAVLTQWNSDMMNIVRQVCPPTLAEAVAS